MTASRLIPFFRAATSASRIRHLEAEIAALQKEMEEIRREMNNPRPRWWWIHIDEEGRTKVVCDKR